MILDNTNVEGYKIEVLSNGVERIYYTIEESGHHKVLVVEESKENDFDSSLLAMVFNSDWVAREQVGQFGKNPTDPTQVEAEGIYQYIAGTGFLYNNLSEHFSKLFNLSAHHKPSQRNTVSDIRDLDGALELGLITEEDYTIYQKTFMEIHHPGMYEKGVNSVAELQIQYVEGQAQVTGSESSPEQEAQDLLKNTEIYATTVRRVLNAIVKGYASYAKGKAPDIQVPHLEVEEYGTSYRVKIASGRLDIQLNLKYTNLPVYATPSDTNGLLSTVVTMLFNLMSNEIENKGLQDWILKSKSAELDTLVENLVTQARGYLNVKDAGK